MILLMLKGDREFIIGLIVIGVLALAFYLASAIRRALREDEDQTPVNRANVVAKNRVGYDTSNYSTVKVESDGQIVQRYYTQHTQILEDDDEKETI